LAMNWLWGSLFIGFGAWSLFTGGTEWWMALLSIGVGIYFFMTQRFEAKVGATASKVASKAAAAVVEQVNKERNAEIDRDAVTADVMTSAAPRAEVMNALDAILGPKWFDAYHGSGLQVAERSADRVVYTFRTVKVPEAFKAEVRVSELDGVTQVVFRCLHQDESNGLRSFADLVTKLRDSVEYAVQAAGDPVRIAEGVTLYGRPAPGSPAAIRARNAKLAMFAGAIICLIPLFQLKQGIEAGELPKWIAVEVAGAAVLYAATKWAKGPSSSRGPHAAAEASGAAAPAIPAVETPGSGGAVDRVLGGLSTALGRFAALSVKNKILIGSAALAAVVAIGFALTGPHSNGYSGSGAPPEYATYEPGSSVAVDSAPESDASQADAPAEEDNASNPSLTRNGNSHYMGAEDVTYYGPSDGSTKHAMVTFVGGTGYSEAAGFEIDDISLGGEDPSQIWDVEVDSSQVGACFVDDSPVSVDEFLAFINGRAESLGGIDFTSAAIVTMKAYSDDYHPSGGY